MIQRHWRPDWRLWLLALLLLPVLVGLGIWQWQRASTKEALFERWEQGELIQWQGKRKLPTGRPVRLQGRFHADRVWLLDNRTFQGHAGYHVLQLFRIEGGPAVVVNRGWVPAPPLRQDLPAIGTPAGGLQIQGRLMDWPEPPVLGEAARATGWPRRAQSLSATDVEAETGVRAEGFVRLVPESRASLRVEDSPPVMPPGRHRGYAFQWFALAVTLLLLTLFASFRRTEEENKEDERFR